MVELAISLLVIIGGFNEATCQFLREEFCLWPLRIQGFHRKRHEHVTLANVGVIELFMVSVALAAKPIPNTFSGHDGSHSSYTSCFTLAVHPGILTSLQQMPVVWKLSGIITLTKIFAKSIMLLSVAKRDIPQTLQDKRQELINSIITRIVVEKDRFVENLLCLPTYPDLLSMPRDVHSDKVDAFFRNPGGCMDGELCQFNGNQRELMILAKVLC